MFEVEIETWGDGADAYPTDVLAELPGVLSALGASGPAVSAGGVAGGLGASFGVDVRAGSGAPEPFSAALQAGIRIFEEACATLGLTHRGIARSVVLTQDMLTRELTQEPETYLGVTELARSLGVSRQRVAELRTRRDFPDPVAELAAGPVWRGSTLRRFVESWDRKPGRPRRVDRAPTPA